MKLTKIFTALALSLHVGVNSSTIINQQAKLPAQTACCTYTSATTQPFANPPFNGAVAVSPQGCLSLITIAGTLFSYEIRPACNLVGPTYSKTILDSFPPIGLTYSPDGSCLIAFGTALSSGFKSILFLSSLPGCNFSTPSYTNVTFPFAVAASNSCITVAQGSIASALSGLLVSCDSAVSNTLTQNFMNVTISPDGSCLAAITTSGELVTYQIQSGCTLASSASSTILGIDVLSLLAFSPDGNCLAIVQPSISQVSSYSVSKCVLSSSPISTAATNVSPFQIAFSPRGNCFAIADSILIEGFLKGNVDIYSIDAQCNIAQIDSYTDTTSSRSSGLAVGWSPDGTCLYFFDSVPNLITLTFPVCAPILTAFIDCKPKICRKGTISYTVSVTNTGTAPAENVVVTNELPSCLTFLNASGLDWTFSNQGQTVTATLGTLAIGATASFSVTAKAYCCKGKKITTTASVTAFNTTPTTASCTSCVK